MCSYKISIVSPLTLNKLSSYKIMRCFKKILLTIIYPKGRKEEIVRGRNLCRTFFAEFIFADFAQILITKIFSIREN